MHKNERVAEIVFEPNPMTICEISAPLADGRCGRLGHTDIYYVQQPEHLPREITRGIGRIRYHQLPAGFRIVALTL